MTMYAAGLLAMVAALRTMAAVWAWLQCEGCMPHLVQFIIRMSIVHGIISSAGRVAA